MREKRENGRSRSSEGESLRETLERSGLRAKKSWGQHFLTDRNILDRLVAAIEVKPPQTVIELGAGPGTLTRRLLVAGYEVIAVERDREFVEFLQKEFRGEPKLTVAAMDAKKLNVRGLIAEGKAPIVGNLPYNIASRIIFNLLKQREAISQGVFMLQYEMAQRVVAKAGTEHYSALSAFIGAYTKAELIKKVPAGAFSPPPKVDSAIVSLMLKEFEMSERLEAAFFAVVNGAFSTRRKQLKNALRGSLKSVDVEALLAECGVDPTSRAEEHPPEKFLELADKLTKFYSK